MEQRNVNIKIVILGESRVGKTSIRKRYMGKGFHASHLMTIGADFANKKVERSGVIYEFQIWDLAGQDSFMQIRKRFLSNTGYCFFVFDLTRKETLYTFNKWMVELTKVNTGRRIPLSVIGNKSDLYTPDSEELEEYRQHLKDTVASKNVKLLTLSFTSAKTGENIEMIFEKIIDYFSKDEAN